MKFSLQSQANILLTLSFGEKEKDNKPLNADEWTKFADWLKEHDLEPSSLLKGNVQTQLSGLQLSRSTKNKYITPDLIEYLLEKGSILDRALERWQRARLWVTTRSDSDYPEKLKHHLKQKSPVVLFGSGNKSLLNSSGLAIIGSRNASDSDLDYTSNLAKKAAAEGYSIVSGGARGVDQSAMSAALDNQGTAIGAMADSLLKATVSKKYRKRIMSNDLVLITPFNPEASFSVGNAMARNKYIYCLADAAVVISSTADKGGTWSGAKKNLEAKWVPLWVYHKTTNFKSGNSALVDKGAKWLPDDRSRFFKDLNETINRMKLENSDHLQPVNKEVKAQTSIISKNTPATDASSLKDEPTSPENRVDDIYEMFILRIKVITAAHALTSKEIMSQLKLEKSQTKAWLTRGLDEGRVKKLSRPVRYQAVDKTLGQGPLFDQN